MIFSGGIFDWDKAQLRLQELNAIVGDATLWEKPERAQLILKERNHLEKSLKDIIRISGELDETLELMELGETEGDEEIITETEDALFRLSKICRKKQLEELGLSLKNNK